MEDFSLCGFCGFAVGVGHGFGVANDHAGGASENFADRPCAVFVGDKEFADALLLGAIVPAAEQGEMIAQEGEVGGFVRFFFECGDGVGCAVFG